MLYSLHSFPTRSESSQQTATEVYVDSVSNCSKQEKEKKFQVQK